VRVRFSCHDVEVSRRRSGGLFAAAASVWLVLLLLAAAARAAPPAERVRLDRPLVVTQLPAGGAAEERPAAGGVLRARYGEGGRLVSVAADGSTKLLSDGFHSACEPDVSFDGSRLLFAGKRTADDEWNVYEMTLADRQVRQITKGGGACRSPCYQGTLFTLDSPQPWYQCTFIRTAATGPKDPAASAAGNLFSCKLDGTELRQLSFTPPGDFDPAVLADGRLVLASRQRAAADRGPLGRVALFAVNIDGTDYSLFAADRGSRIKHMPCATAKGLVVFVETDESPWDGAGSLSCVTTRRPLHSYRQIAKPGEGLFHSPSPLPDGRILVSRRSADGKQPHAVYRLDPATGRSELVFGDARYHCIQAKVLASRPEPDGRSSNVREEDPHGRLYCLDVYKSDLKDPAAPPRGTIKRLRVLGSGVPSPLGEIDVDDDGSFHLELPANTPVQLQTLDASGKVLRSCTWIWARNHESRGCIGCHEDGELTPQNRFPTAVGRPPAKLGPPPRATGSTHSNSP